ncbi:MAG TPA: GNAT family N-acetyltransferase [Methanotrichaceae archaeon]|nr:GNAT family N-acetyltransferase [Methanotrichaceae archaeon]
MGKQVEIIPATIEDALEILALQKLAYQSEARIYNDWTIQPLRETAEDIRAEFNTHVFLKAVSERLLVGSVRACTMGTTCYIGKLIVHPQWQNQGIATRLIAEAEMMHRDTGRFELFTGSKSAKNIHLYHKCGYQEFRREKLNDSIELVYLEKIVPNFGKDTARCI